MNNKRQIFRNKLRKIAIKICCFEIVLANVGLFLCCIFVFRAILDKQMENVIFCFEMVALFIFTLYFSNYFKDYLD
ncbi:MAG TPA: hypothetical protein VIM70_08815 [Clostridium sp.]|uniref:hypothetical protein n=1 Tax=Clostridium sp. TaxID=1506 RepID=UPI002F920B09